MCFTPKTYIEFLISNYAIATLLSVFMAVMVMIIFYKQNLRGIKNIRNWCPQQLGKLLVF